jgi:hypothetical protein
VIAGTYPYEDCAYNAKFFRVKPSVPVPMFPVPYEPPIRILFSFKLKYCMDNYYMTANMKIISSK